MKKKHSDRSVLNKLQCLGDSILQAILDDDSDKLLDLISSHLSDTTIFFLPPISKKLPEFLSGSPSLLSLSCFFASMKCFHLLLSLNSKVDEKDSKGRIAIHFAAAGGSLEMLRELDQITQSEPSTSNQNGTNGHKNKNIYNYEDHNHMTPISYAAQFGRLDVIKYLYLKGGKLDLRNILCYRPIHFACLYGHVDVVRFFVENGVSITDRFSMHPIHYAAIGGDAATIEYLLSQNADPNARYDSDTPLYYASKFGSLAAIKVLVKHNAEFKQFNKQSPPILVAALNGHLDVVRYFIEQGCDPNLYNSRGYSVLFKAVVAKNIDIVKYLFSQGATIFPDGRYDNSSPKKQLVKSKYISMHGFENPIDYIYDRNEDILLLLLNHINIEEYLRDDYSARNCNQNFRQLTLIHAFIHHQSEKLLDFFIQHNIIAGDCSSIYMKVIDKKLDKVAKLMLDKKVQFSSTTQLIDKLIKFNNSSLFQKFLESGLQVRNDNNPQVAADVISSFMEHKSFELIDLLIEYKVFGDDCTDLYCNTLTNMKVEFAELFLEKGLPFHSTHNLAFVAVNYNNSCLLPKFLDSGLQISPEDIQQFTKDAILTYQVDLIRTLLKLKLLSPDMKLISRTLEFPLRNYNNELVSCITVILRCCIPSLFHSAPTSKDTINLTEILKLFLSHGFTFSSDDRPISITFKLKNKDIELLYHLFKIIEKSCPESIDFSKYTISNIEGLLYHFNSPLARYFLNFFFSHNFSFKSNDDKHKYNDFHLFLTALLGKISTFEAKTSLESFLGLDKHSALVNNDPDLELIYYLFDHDYIVSSRSLNAIVKVGLKTNNPELIHKAFQHCDLSNQPIIARKGPIYSKTALEIACKNELVDIAQELIERGANVNEGGYNNLSSPLFYAMSTNNEELIQLLKSKNAILNVGDYKSKKPLHQLSIHNEFRAKYGRKKMKIKLLQK